MPETPKPVGTDKRLFALYDELDRIEELLEDMLDLKISSKDEAERRIVELNEQIDQIEEGGA
jgi:hypothetical protein